MIVAAAQIKVQDGNIEANMGKHCSYANIAANKGARLILFPEMSLTGYLREEAQQHKFAVGDERLQPLQQIADERNIIIVAGAPIEIGEQLHIGAFIIQPDNKVEVYTKRFLHPGEEVAFEPSLNHNPTLQLDGETISIAICADTANPRHPMEAAANNATLYIAGVFDSPNGVIESHERLSRYAKQHKMKVLYTNFVGTTYNSPAAGQSAAWNNEGELLQVLTTDKEDLLVIEL